MKDWIKTGLIISVIILILNIVIGGKLGRNSLEAILLIAIIGIIGFGLSLLASFIRKFVSKKSKSNKDKK